MKLKVLTNPACDTSAIPASSSYHNQRDDDVEGSTNGSTKKILYTRRKRKRKHVIVKLFAHVSWLQDCVVRQLRHNTYTPDPVDHLELLVQLIHEDNKEDNGEDHLTDGHSRVAPTRRRSKADDDDEADELRTGLGKKTNMVNSENNYSEETLFIAGSLLCDREGKEESPE